MNNIWFTSDSHYGHVNILQFESTARPFTDIKEMNEHLIHMWNSVIRPNDVVFHLGDFCFGKHNLPIAGKLHGKKRLIMGNHDTYANADYLRYFDKLYGVKYWEQCILSHVPVHPDSINGFRCKLSVHGHWHSRTVKLPAHRMDEFPVEDLRYYNVSVERHNLTPVHADLIRDRIKLLDAGEFSCEA